MNVKDKVVYQIYPKSFQDSDGDGIGDIRGIIQRLDYLQNLGVDFIWSTPFFVSPQNDNGYDVADYYHIDPRFGTMEDLEELIREADKRGMGLMLDMVFNHTSTEHEWFQRALAGEQKYQDFYFFREGKPDVLPTNWVSKFGGSAWKYVTHLEKWYLHLFDETQADLNWENPQVREELKQILLFWKEKGIKGFRFDVVNLISKPEVFENDLEGDGRRFYTDGRHVHEFLKELSQDVELSEMITVGEMSSTSIENCIRYSNPMEKELSMCFSFHHLKVDYKDGQKWALMPPDYRCLNQLFRDWQMKMQEKDGWNAVFWCNHDQPRIVSRLGDDQKYWKESAKMLATVIHLLRGTPYIYQGEEIGMTNAYYRDITQYRDVESLNYYQILLEEGKSEEEALHILAARSRDNSRTPMQWDGTEHAGFTAGTPWIDLPDSDREIMVESQIMDPDSIYAYYKELIRIRKTYKVVSEGRIDFMDAGTEQIFAYIRSKAKTEKTYGKEESRVETEKTQGEESGEGTDLVVICNWKGSACEMTLPGVGTYRKLLGNYADGREKICGRVALRPYECYVLQRAGDNK